MLDWGSVTCLTVVGTYPELFSRVVVGNGILPDIPAGTPAARIPNDIEKAVNTYRDKIASIPAKQPKFYNSKGELEALFKGP